MANILHSVLQGSEIHEPKGIDSATENQVYVSDGLGSGGWKTAWNAWWWNYDHSASTPTTLSAGVKTDLINDGSGVAQLDFMALPTATGSGIWDTTNNEFNWVNGGMKLGGTVEIRFDLTYTVNSNNDGFLLELDLAHGTGSELSLPVAQYNIDVAGSQRFIVPYVGFIGSDPFLNNPAKLSITADSAGDSVLLNGFYVKVDPIFPEYI